MLITVAIACYQSENTIESVVHQAIDAIKRRKENDYQIILVSDGSRDDTFKKIQNLCEKDNKILGIELTKNYGQENAKLTAISYAKGDVLVSMDDDGEHPAEKIYELIDKLDEGYDAVFAKFTHKTHNLFRKFCSVANAKVLTYIGVIPKGVSFSGFFAMNKLCVDLLKQYNSPFPSLGSYLTNVTNRMTNVEMVQQSRLSGKSGYTLHKLISLWLTNVVSFSMKTIRLASVIGLFSASIGILLSIVLIVRKIINPDIAMGYTSIMSTILIVGGIIMLIVGLMGEFIGKTYMTISDLPRATVRKEINTSNNEDN